MAEATPADWKLRTDVGDRVLAPEEFVKLALFEGLPLGQLKNPPDSVVLRQFGPGDVICRQDEQGWTAFYILTDEEVALLRGETGGRAEQAAANAVAAVAAAPTARSKVCVYVRQRGEAVQERLVGGLLGWLTRGLESARMKEDASAAPQDSLDPSHDPRQKCVATLFEGELFGEMSCLNRAPRTATVQATEQVYVIEMLRSIFERARDNKKNNRFKERLESVYRQRAIRSHLEGFPLFQEIPVERREEVLVYLRPRVELIEKEPGQVLFSQGDPPDGIYLISIGQIKVVRKDLGGERVLAYRERGEMIGEIGAVRQAHRMATCIAYEHPCREGHRKPKTPGRIELLRIQNEDFDWLMRNEAAVRSHVERVIRERTEEPEIKEADMSLLALADRYHELGLPQGQKLMLIDLDRCTRCDECVRACADTHVDGRARLLREGPRFGHYLVPASCRQCRDPVCLIGCPVSSIHKGERGHIVIEEWCIGCKACAEQCPYDAINMHERSEPEPAATNRKSNGSAAPPTPAHQPRATLRDLAVVCDQCSSLVDGLPSCVYACPHDAAIRIDAEDFFK